MVAAGLFRSGAYFLRQVVSRLDRRAVLYRNTLVIVGALQGVSRNAQKLS